MKRSIFIAFIILAAVVGWIGSGQFSNNVVAQDDDTETSTETEISYSQDTENNDDEEFTFSVETKIFTSSLIDQSIELQGQTIHNEFIWTDGVYISPTTSNLVTFASTGGNAFAVSQWEPYTAQQGVGPIPTDLSDVTIISNRISPTDTFFFNPNLNSLKYLVSNTAYAPTFGSVSQLLADPSLVNLPLSGVSPIVTGTFTYPSTTDNYLYLIYDYRRSFESNLCYDASSAFGACCDCDCGEEVCNTWEIRNYGPNSITVTYVNCDDEEETETIPGNGGSGYAGDEVCSLIEPSVTTGDATQVEITLYDCECVI